MAEHHPTDDVVRVADVATPQEAHLWRQALEEEGIHCQVTGDYLDASFGSLDNIKAEVLVRRHDLDRARAVIARFTAAKAAAATQPEETDEES